MKGSSLSAAICRAIRFPGLAMMILLCVGAGSPRSEPSVSPPQTQHNRASQPIAGPEFKQRQIACLIGLAKPIRSNESLIGPCPTTKTSSA